MFFLFSLMSTGAYADCTSPAAVAGQFQFISPDYKYCDGTNWQTMNILDTGSACATSGVLTKNGSDLQYCNGTNWISANSATVSSCTGTTAGTMTWKSGSSRMEWCDGSNWKVVGNICAGKSVGQTCEGTPALYAGVFNGNAYMIMPSGCPNDTSNPNCSGGSDSVDKTWSAAQTYCNSMVYGGYSDWYLPSIIELAYIYCKSNPPNHNPSNPPDNPNCGGSGPTGELTGFGAHYYWSSDEYSAFNGLHTYFYNGDKLQYTKTEDFRVRCIRHF